jgi:hypothetical protein
MSELENYKFRIGDIFYDADEVGERHRAFVIYDILEHSKIEFMHMFEGKLKGNIIVHVDDIKGKLVKMTNMAKALYA